MRWTWRWKTSAAINAHLISTCPHVNHTLLTHLCIHRGKVKEMLLNSFTSHVLPFLLCRSTVILLWIRQAAEVHLQQNQHYLTPRLERERRERGVTKLTCRAAWSEQKKKAAVQEKRRQSVRSTCVLTARRETAAGKRQYKNSIKINLGRGGGGGGG